MTASPERPERPEPPEPPARPRSTEPTGPTGRVLPLSLEPVSKAAGSTTTGSTEADRPERPRVSFYEAVGGAETFQRLVHRFYEEVARDAELRPMYPEADLTGAEDRLRMFLVQYWGGPHDYSETRGHPRLRMRHVRFAVTPDARDRWLTHIRTALDELALDEPYETMLWDYLVTAAHSLVNTVE